MVMGMHWGLGNLFMAVGGLDPGLGGIYSRPLSQLAQITKTHEALFKVAVLKVVQSHSLMPGDFITLLYK